MINVTELLELLISKDIKLKVEGGKLKYNAPAGSVTEELLSAIKVYKSELIDFISSRQMDRIKTYSNKECVPLSFAQNRLWFLDKLEEDSYAYNLPFPVKIEGELNIDALKSAIKYILNRHSVLRTSFPEKDGIPYQKINETPENIFDVENASGNSEEEKWEWIKNEIAVQMKTPFDLYKGPLYGIRLFYVDENIHVLLMVFHHIILDGWSIDILMKEIGESYKAFSKREEPDLPKLEIQYSDFSIWHNEWMNSEPAKAQLEFWKKELVDAPALLQMPLVYPRPAVQTPNGSTELFEIDNELFTGMKKLAKENETSLFMLLYAAVTVLLYRYSHQEDIAIGTTIANRNRAEIEPLIGLFANTIVLRSDLSGNPSFKNYLARVKEKTLNAFVNQDIPFEKIVEEMKPERSLSHTPLFQILFELQDIPGKHDDNTGLKMTAIEPENTSAKFDMNLLLLIQNGCLAGNLEYNSDLFNKNYIRRFIDHYKKLLRSVVDKIDNKIDEIDYVTDEEKELINSWNDTKKAFPLDKTFNELFLESVRKNPDKIAVVENSYEITYWELNQRAESLARDLIERGAGAEKIVAIISERGIKFLISILAVFKSGAAYLPLDTHHPPARHAQIIEQSEPIILLAERKFDERLDEAVKLIDRKNIARINIDNLLEDKPEEISPAKTSSTSKNLAYIIFTSGSTGKPKGAMVLQKGMINHLYSKIRDLGITSDDYVAQNASQCFDISVWQYLAALLVGGKIEIFPDEIAHDAERLLEKVEKNKITILEIVPSFMSVMIEMIETKSGYTFKNLRWLVPTGEALPPELAAKWLQNFPNVPLINAYGPTECSDDVTHYPIHKVDDFNNFSVPIGRPIANTQILILDKNKRIVPIGVVGELYVAGDCVGRGYINDEERTHAAFVENPFKPGGIIYKSGDLARYLPDGNIEFLGRIDSQVKVRGFRIELGEIETELRKHSEVKEAVVLVSRDGKELIGYIVAQKEGIDLIKNIKESLANKLPEYMIPSYFVLMEKLPLTSNGKINRKVLPEPEMDREREKISLPETETEKTIADIWKELLRVEEVGINQNFFEIGGHSLLATRLVTKLRDKFSVELALKIIFEKTTVKNLSEYIDTLLWLKENQNNLENDDVENIII
jgi:amino acid adenylation domain-containing protein